MRVYIDAFGDTVEYCDWKADRIQAAARRNLHGYFEGERGAPLPASRVALAPVQGFGPQPIIGAALIVEPKPGQTMLDLLFVLPEWQQHGVATALVSGAMNELYRAGVPSLYSRYHLANAASRAWHRGFGFVDQPDLFLAQHLRSHARHELRQRDQIRELDAVARAELVAELEYWETRVRELEIAAGGTGLDALLPLLQDP